MGGDKNVRTTRHSVKVKMREERTSAIVLRSRAHGESDKIVTFLTRDWGKVTGIAKGAKRARHRFVNGLEALTQVPLRLRPCRADARAFFVGCDLMRSLRRSSSYIQLLA